jgi:hypothetical protein
MNAPSRLSRRSLLLTASAVLPGLGLIAIGAASPRRPPGYSIAARSRIAVGAATSALAPAATPFFLAL